MHACMCVCVCVYRWCEKICALFCLFFAAEPEKGGDVSAHRPRRRGPHVQENVSDAFTRWRCRSRLWHNERVGLANSKGSPHAVELINPLFQVAKVSLRGMWLLGVVILKDVWQDLPAPDQFLTCQIVNADIQLSFARLIRFKDASAQISESSLQCFARKM